MFGFHTWRGGGGGAGQGGVWRRDYPQGKGAPTRAGALCDYQDELLSISVGFFFFFFQHSWLKPPSSSYSQQRRIHLVSFLYMCVQSHTNDGWDQSCFGTKKNTFVHYQLDLKLNLTDMDTENKSAETWAINMYSRSSTDFHPKRQAE